MIGKLTALGDEPTRTVVVTIAPDLLSSELSMPQGAVTPLKVMGIILERRRWLFRDIIRIWFQTDEGEIEFYRSRSMFDIALLLDELEAAIGHRPRTLKNIQESEQAADGDTEESV
jgi:hypothetical protein